MHQAFREQKTDERQTSDTKDAQGRQGESANKPKGTASLVKFPSLLLPKGGGAIQGIGEKFQANPVTGTGSMSVPIAISPGRSGFAPQLALSYDSGAGNGAFGLGWDVGLPSISRKTQKGLPQYDGLPKYQDATDIDSDVFLLSGAEDLVPVLKNGVWDAKTVGNFRVYPYRPRIEGLFAKIEKWVELANSDTHWRATTKDNLTSIYGLNADSRIADPEYSNKVFSWLLERTFDNKGNVLIYEYKREDLADVAPAIFEKNRNADNATKQQYLKRVKYGNTIPYLSTMNAPIAAVHTDNKWHFELVFDYGEHHNDANGLPQYAPAPTAHWTARPDPFSSYRAGFEIRDYRLCRRILMFHRFPELGADPYLVKATLLEYNENKIATQVNSITHAGYLTENGATTIKTFPPINFKYTEQKIDNTIYTIAAGDLPNAPEGIDGKRYQLVDLDGEGLSGIFTQSENAWYYKRNLGDGSFGPKEVVQKRPVPVGAGVADYEGNGLNDYVLQNGGLNGYFEMDDLGEWQPFRAFTDIPNIDWNDPNMRSMDLDGDGIADLLITENDCFIWYPSKAKEGFDPARRVAKALDEEQGPRIVFQEAFQTVFLADLSGSGMTDICRIRNGEVCYWPNLGYARFGAKVTMANAPHFDHPDAFDPARIRLADIDGAGPTDIIYLGGGQMSYWINQSGNAWGERKTVPGFPAMTPLHSIQAMDLLGNGTSCIVWSSPLPGEANAPLRYIQLMGKTETEGNKPYLLKEVDNNMGAVTRLKYEASTRFYLDDRKAGRPWITKLAFPVQVLTLQEVYDAISDTHFVSKYAYHHGYFDPIEREFRGFGMVEQWDTEHFDAFQEAGLFAWKGKNWTKDSFIPPVHTKTWFHNGYYRQSGKITRQYESDYYGARDAQGKFTEWTLPDTVLPDGLMGDVAREAARALKGRPLRVEVYADDAITDPDLAKHPYTVTESNYQIKVMQPKGDNRHTVFFAVESETLTFQYERNPLDPRIAHSVALKLDEFGNPIQNLAVVYPRRVVTNVYPEQEKLYCTYMEAAFINKPDAADFYRIGVPYQQQLFEVTGLKMLPNQAFSKKAILEALDGNALLAIPAATSIEFEAAPDLTKVQKRLVQSAKTTFYQADLSGELPEGDIAHHGLPFKAWEAAYTDAQLQAWFDTKLPKDPANLVSPEEYTMNLGGFEKENGYWWRPSGKVIFDAAQFYQPIQQIDLFGQTVTLEYDPYRLLPKRSFTAIHGVALETSAEFDYRSLQPKLLTDPNGNRSEAITDALGMVIATAIKGKTTEMLGDTLVGYIRPDLPETDDHRAAIFAAPLTDYLQGASTFFHYDLHAWSRETKPPFALSIARREHHADNTTPLVQLAIGYSDGFGRQLLTKVQAESGKALYWDASAQVVKESVPGPRWVGNGRTVFNNKGKPVKQYEPYFSTNWDYEDETALREYGVTPVLQYDPAGRVVRTDMPDGTFSKVEFTPWEQRTYDQNDTVLDSEWYKRRTDNTRADYIANTYEQRAALLAKAHAKTPKTEYFDTMGRIFLLQDHNGFAGNGAAQLINTRFKLDIEGNQIEVKDAKQRIITRNTFNLTGEAVYTQSMDAGKRWMLTNALGNPVWAWNERGFHTEMTYDALQRPLGIWVKSPNGSPKELIQFNIYGEMLTDSEAKPKNLLGQVWRHFDAAGCLTSEAHDFKGNLLKGSLQPAKTYKTVPDWSAVAASIAPSANLESLLDAAANTLLESNIFETETTFDAFSRPKTANAPDGSLTTYFYNEAGLLEKTRLVHGRTGADSEPVKKIEYDAKGQRLEIQYGNEVTTTYEYDPLTFRPTHLRSTKPVNLLPHIALQDLQYYYDPVGNITDLRDDAQQNLFFNNSVVEAHGAYEYDSLYRLLSASGREHIGQTDHFSDDIPDFLPKISPQDGSAMRNYLQQFEYDELGNILKVTHHAGTGNFQNNWTREYFYETLVPLDNNTTQIGNRLSKTVFRGLTSPYTYDVHGNMKSMSHLPDMQWDYADQLCAITFGNGEMEYYAYDAGGQRSRKVWEKNGVAYERFYLGPGFEVYRERRLLNDDILMERESLHVMDDKNRVAQVETLTSGVSSDGETIGVALYRFQLANHLGSACLETDGEGILISYEEYYPFGSTAYSAVSGAISAARKRYRYTGLERDESSGLDYYGARYYVGWLGRWCSCDPAGFVDGWNLFVSVNNNPIVFNDPTGTNAEITIDKSTNTITVKANFYYYVNKDGSPNSDQGHDAKSAVEKSMENFKNGWQDLTTTKLVDEYEGWQIKFDIKIEPVEADGFKAFESKMETDYNAESEKNITNFIYYDKNLINKDGEKINGIAKGNLILLGESFQENGSTLQHEIAHALGIPDAANVFNTEYYQGKGIGPFSLVKTETQGANTSTERVGPITSYNNEREIKIYEQEKIILKSLEMAKSMDIEDQVKSVFGNFKMGAGPIFGVTKLRRHDKKVHRTYRLPMGCNIAIFQSQTQAQA
jgi:RHS repeat-associated protein